MSAKKSGSLGDSLKKQTTSVTSSTKKSNASPDKPDDTMKLAKDSTTATVTEQENVVNIDFAKAAEDVKENEVTLGDEAPPIGSDNDNENDNDNDIDNEDDKTEKTESVMNSTIEIGAELDETLPKATLDALGAIEEDEDGERDGQTTLEKTNMGEGSPSPRGEDIGDSDEDDAFARSNTIVLPPDDSDEKKEELDPVAEEAPEDGDQIQE